MQLRWEVFNTASSVRFDVHSVSRGLTFAAGFGKYGDVLTNPHVMRFALRYEF